jgi:AcrR family transcriptional regulator
MIESETRENILKVSFSQFIDRPYYKVSIDSICSELDVSKGAVFHYFNSKYELACEALSEGFTKLWSPHLKQIMSKGTPQAKLKQFIRSSVQVFMEHPKLRRFSFEVYEEGNERGEKNDDCLRSYREHMDLATSLYQSCGLSDCEERARILMASLDGLSFLVISDETNERLDADEISNILVELFVPEPSQMNRAEDHSTP